jgi:hypothetical protein
MTPLAHIAGLLPALPFVVPVLVTVTFLVQLSIRDRLKERRSQSPSGARSAQQIQSKES